MPPEDRIGSAMNAASPPELWRSIRSNASIQLGAPVHGSVGIDEARPVGVRGEHRHRADRRRTVAATPRRVGRARGAARHAMPALCEADHLPSAGDDLRHLEGGLVGLGAGGEQQHLRQAGHQRTEHLGQVDDRAGQHSGVQVVEPADEVAHDIDDLRVRMAEDRAHLPAREVEHAAT